MSQIPGLGRSPGGGNSNLFQYSCQENPMDRGAWWATVPEVMKNWTGLGTDARMSVVRTQSLGLRLIPGWGTIIKKPASCQVQPHTHTKETAHREKKACSHLGVYPAHIQYPRGDDWVQYKLLRSAWEVLSKV